jgi:hypothetical protein
MKLLRFDLELVGQEILLNGIPIYKGHQGFDEKLLEKYSNLEQQWQLMCELRKLCSKIETIYLKNRTKLGEISMDQYESLSKGVTSAMDGIPGTTIGSLRDRSGNLVVAPLAAPAKDEFVVKAKTKLSKRPKKTITYK